MKTKLIVLGFVAIILGGLGLWAIKNQTANVVSTAGWKTYMDDEYGVQFQYPVEFTDLQAYGPSYKGTFDTFFRAINSSGVTVTNTFSIHGENQPTLLTNGAGSSYCFEVLCDKPAQSQVTYNGIVWDYLGSTSYSDVGDTWTRPAVYRTFKKSSSKNPEAYYFTFNTREFGESILSTFKFTK